MTPGATGPLTIEIVDTPKGARQVKLTGPLILRTLLPFQQTAREEASKPVILDLSQMPYMDSAGLGAVIGFFSATQKAGQGFGLIGVSPRIRTLLEITHTDTLLPSFTSLEDAEAAVTAPKS